MGKKKKRIKELEHMNRNQSDLIRSLMRDKKKREEAAIAATMWTEYSDICHKYADILRKQVDEQEG